MYHSTFLEAVVDIGPLFFVPNPFCNCVYERYLRTGQVNQVEIVNNKWARATVVKGPLEIAVSFL
jgi:hypothetical protein